MSVLFVLTVPVGCLGDVMSGEGKSLMEQLRGEALKFHKPGEKEQPEQLDAAVSLLVALLSYCVCVCVDLSSFPSSHRREL